MTTQQLLLSYAANSISSTDVCEHLGLENNLDVADILNDFQREWEAAECNADGATQEQNKTLDAILDTAAATLDNLRK